MGGASTNTALAKLLEAAAKHYRWAAATSGSQSAASLMLASNGAAVMAIGGFNGEGGNISLAQFEKYVKAGEIRYFVVSSGGTGMGGGSFGDAGGGATERSASSGTQSLFGSTNEGGPSGSGSGSSGSGSGSSGPGSASSGASSGSAPSGSAPSGSAPSGGVGEMGGSSSDGLPGGSGRSGGFGAGGPGGSETSSQILAWVKAHFTARTVGGTTVYDLTSAKS